MTEQHTAADKDHAVRSPSGAYRRKKCPGSVVLNRDAPRTTNKFSAEGTAAHYLALDLCIPQGKRAEAFEGRKIEADGFEFVVDGEMIRHVNSFLDYVDDMIDVSKGDVLLVEQEVGIGHITGEKGGTGTADVIGICENGTHMKCIDLKYGAGVLVEIEDEEGDPNEQTVYYLAGSWEDNLLIYDEVETFTLAVFQPRKDYVAELTLSRAELLEQIERLRIIEARCNLAETEHEAMTVLNTDPHDWIETWLNPGEKQCKFCDAAKNLSCPARNGAVMDAVTAGGASADSFPDLDVEPDAVPKALAAAIRPASTLDGDRLAACVRSLALVEGWVKDVKEERDRRVFADPASVPGYGLFYGDQGDRKWTDAAEAEARLKKARIPADVMYTKKVITAPQAEKALKKDKPKLWKDLQELIARAPPRPMVDQIGCGKQPYEAAAATSFPDETVHDLTALEDDPLLQ